MWKGMAQTLIIHGRMPDLNAILSEAFNSRYAYGRMKKDETERVFWSVKEQGIRPVCSAYFIFTWFEKNKRKDPDNVVAARKFIMDGLVKAKVIKTDGWAHVLGWIDVLKVDQRAPRVEVQIKERKS